VGYQVRITSKLAGERGYESLARLRKQLGTRSSIRVDLENPAHVIRTRPDGKNYFDVFVDQIADLKGAIERLAPRPAVELTPVSGENPEPCLRCGFVSLGEIPPSCSRCGFRNISACPYCATVSAPGAYRNVNRPGLRCPRCGGHVELRFSDPLFDERGEYAEPVVLVVTAGRATR
jgi:hypothetical protein